MSEKSGCYFATRGKDLVYSEWGAATVSQTESTCQPDSALADKVIEVLADKLGKPARTIHLEDDLLLDLGVDSLNMAELTVLVEQVGGVRIPGDALLDARTVGDLVVLLARYSPSDSRRDSAMPQPNGDADPGRRPVPR
jgi:acyl carrier protein